MIKLKNILLEIGEANVNPFTWQRTAGVSAAVFKERMEKEVHNDGYDIFNRYEFTTDKGTVYVVDMDIETVMGVSGPTGAIECEIDFATKSKVGIATMDATNRHEQYAVMSTITDIFIAWVNEWDNELYINSITIDPIKDEGEEIGVFRTSNQRGKLYHAFMKKQLHKLNKQYHIRVFDDHFEISPTFMKPDDADTTKQKYDFTGIVDK